jgi:hypothetical protein
MEQFAVFMPRHQQQWLGDTCLLKQDVVSYLHNNNDPRTREQRMYAQMMRDPGCDIVQFGVSH